MRIGFAACILLTIGAEIIAAPLAAASGCDDKFADPYYCREGKPRPVCLEKGQLVWRDTHDALSRGEFTFLTANGKVAQPRCSDKP